MENIEKASAVARANPNPRRCEELQPSPAKNKKTRKPKKAPKVKKPKVIVKRRTLTEGTKDLSHYLPRMHWRWDGEKKNNKKKLLTFQQLSDIQKKDPQEIILDLLSDANIGFFRLLQEPRQQPIQRIRDILPVVFEILKKVCESSFDDLKIKILQRTLTPLLLDKVNTFTKQLPIKKCVKQGSKVCLGWIVSIDILEVCAVLKAITPMPLLTILNNIDVNVSKFKARHSCRFSDDLKNTLEPIKPMERTVKKLQKTTGMAMEKYIFKLDDAQLAALRGALTQELTLIQGPPGTGKTTVAIRIAQTFLANMDKWYKQTPMLVICPTNTELDQFLEGLLSEIQTVIRVGFSESEKLKQVNLQEHRGPMCSAVCEMKSEVEGYALKIKEVTDSLEQADSYDRICDFDDFKETVLNYDRSWFYTASKKEILRWLLEGGPQVTFEAEYFKALSRVIFPLYTLQDYNDKLSYFHRYLKEFRDMSKPKRSLPNILRAEKIRNQLKAAFDYLKDHLNTGKNCSHHLTPKALEIEDPTSMRFEDRWGLYFYLLDLHRQALKQKLQDLNLKFDEAHKIYEKLREAEDVCVLKNAYVVGITTTDAARLRLSLQALKSPVVIMEGAREMFKANIVTSITKHYRHLILTGDHQQHDQMHLFERMNKVPCYKLNVQHRMRPEIAALIAPAIYPELKNHPSVSSPENIKGVDKCVFFIDHKYQDDFSGTSKVSQHEAKFLMELACHLIMNGYRIDQITILAAHWNQLVEMQKLKRSVDRILDGLNITVVDNYRGQECDIILLSTAPNNDVGEFEVATMENRVSVALSRARIGLYLIGNMTQLCSRSELWRTIRQMLAGQGGLGEQLALRCQIHEEEVTYVADWQDFQKVPGGGCARKCEVKLLCGHKCDFPCHGVDRRHTAMYKCRKTCKRKLCKENKAHKCQKPCYIPCPTLCDYIVMTTLPCGHSVDKLCYMDPETITCPYPCNVPVAPCGHFCVQTCHIGNDPNHLKYQCEKKCDKKTPRCTAPEQFKHACPRLCFQPCDPSPCKGIITKIIPSCGHAVKLLCWQEPNRVRCTRECQKKLKCGHPCVRKCNEPCTGLCDFRVEHPSTSGHQRIVSIPCHLATAKPDPREWLQYFTIPCGTKLQCSHICPGNYGSCLLGIHQRCTERCDSVLLCDHPCTLTCGRICRSPPCSRPCEIRCKHRSCQKKCGEPCTPCNEPCSRRCEHVRCTKMCGELCDVKPCSQRCRRKLRCGHACVGFCGDPCPKKCRVCDKPTAFFGTETGSSRFVLLVDCGHVLESKGLEEWLAKNSNVVGFKRCPVCMTPIKRTNRFKHLTKREIDDITTVRRLLDKRDHDKERKERLEMRSEICDMIVSLGKNYPKLTNLLRTLKKYDRFNHEDLRLKFQIVHYMWNNLAMIGKSDCEIIEIDLLSSVLLTRGKTITNQEIHDINNELERMTRKVDLFRIRQTLDFQSLKDTPTVIEILQQLEAMIDGPESFKVPDSSRIRLLEELKNSVGAEVEISQANRVPFLKARDFRKGIWYRCRKGHAYAKFSTFGGPKCMKCVASYKKECILQCRIERGSIFDRLIYTEEASRSKATYLANYFDWNYEERVNPQVIVKHLQWR